MNANVITSFHHRFTNYQDRINLGKVNEMKRIKYLPNYIDPWIGTQRLDDESVAGSNRIRWRFCLGFGFSQFSLVLWAQWHGKVGHAALHSSTTWQIHNNFKELMSFNNCSFIRSVAMQYLFEWNFSQQQALEWFRFAILTAWNDFYISCYKQWSIGYLERCCDWKNGLRLKPHFPTRQRCEPCWKHFSSSLWW